MSKKKDSTEALVNVMVGAIINWILTMIMFEEHALYVTGATVVFMLFSFLRAYCIRRIFRNKDKVYPSSRELSKLLNKE